MFYLITDNSIYELPLATCETLQECGEWLHTTRQAVYNAIKTGCTVATKYLVFKINGKEEK